MAVVPVAVAVVVMAVVVVVMMAVVVMAVVVMTTVAMAMTAAVAAGRRVARGGEGRNRQHEGSGSGSEDRALHFRLLLSWSRATIALGECLLVPSSAQK